MKTFLIYDNNWEHNWKRDIVYIITAENENEAIICIREHQPNIAITKIEEINSKEKSIRRKKNNDEYFLIL